MWLGDDGCQCGGMHWQPSSPSHNMKYDAEIFKRKYQKVLLQTLAHTFNDIQNVGENSSTNEHNHKRGYTVTKMHFKEAEFVTLRRSEMFGSADFLASCGGLLGLFLGFSFLSLVELFYFFTLWSGGQDK